MSSQLAFLLESKLVDPLDPGAIEQLLGRLVDDNVPGAPDSILILNAQHQEVLALRSPRLLPVMLPPVASGALRQVALADKVEVLNVHSPVGELVQAIAPVKISSLQPQTWFLATSLLIPTAHLAEMQAIQAGLNDYQHLIIIKAPMKLSLIILLIVVTMLIVFGSIWLGLYVSRTLTTPINDLALATRRVAEGDLAFQLEHTVDDEMGVLVNSFNAMTANLSKSNQELAQTHFALEKSNEVSEHHRNYLETILDKQGQILLYSVAWPPQNIYSNKPINSAADLKGLKWRVYSPTTARIGELVGAQPVTIQEAELSQALATGVIEGLITSSATGADNKLYENLKYFYEVQAWIPKNAVTVNKKAFNALPKAEQDAVRKAAAAAEERGWKSSREVNASSIETLKKGGMQVLPPSAQLAADLHKVGDVVVKEWLEKAGADGKALVEAFNKSK